MWSPGLMTFGASSSLSPLVDKGGRNVWSADKKASLFSAHSGAKQRRDSFQHPYSCDSCPVLCSVAFRFSFVCSLLLDLDPNGGNDPNGMFSHFYMTAPK